MTAFCVLLKAGMERGELLVDGNGNQTQFFRIHWSDTTEAFEFPAQVVAGKHSCYPPHEAAAGVNATEGLGQDGLAAWQHAGHEDLTSIKSTDALKGKTYPTM